MPGRTVIASLMLAGLLGIGTVASSADLAGQEKVARAVAEKTALSRVPGGRVREAELELEHGRLVWSFDIAQPTSRDIIEVQVDANSGKVVSIVTESPADQAREVAADKADAAAKGKPKAP